MSESFAELLNEVGADRDTIQQALRLHLSERSGDRTKSQMLAEVRGAASSEEELDRQLKALEQDPAVLEQAALVYFAQAWEEDDQRASIRSAFKNAKSRLPVVETVALAVAAMYGLYLLTTRGVTRRQRTVTTNPDGSYTETEDIEYGPFAPVVSAMTQLFGGN